MLELAENPLISGFTTNPTLMRKAGVDDYEGFARKVLDHITDRPVSFEVFSDDFEEMRDQAHRIASWGDNVCVKIPVTDTQGASSAPLVADLTADGLHLNVTALLALDQVRTAAASLAASPGAVVSVFAGRVADTGRDPGPTDGRGGRDTGRPPDPRAALGQSAGDPQCAPGRIQSAATSSP
jgi:transaldolase